MKQGYRYKQIYKGCVLGRGGRGRPRKTYADQSSDVLQRGHVKVQSH